MPGNGRVYIMMAFERHITAAKQNDILQLKQKNKRQK